MFRVPPPAQVQADANAMLARVDAMFDVVMAQSDALLDKYRATGVLRDPHSRTRAGDPPAGQGA